MTTLKNLRERHAVLPHGYSNLQPQYPIFQQPSNKNYISEPTKLHVGVHVAVNAETYAMPYYARGLRRDSVTLPPSVWMQCRLGFLVNPAMTLTEQSLREPGCTLLVKRRNVSSTLIPPVKPLPSDDYPNTNDVVPFSVQAFVASS